jgi:ABC-type multidrug transport system fused ATPase/permease subunit
MRSNKSHALKLLRYPGIRFLDIFFLILIITCQTLMELLNLALLFKLIENINASNLIDAVQILNVKITFDIFLLLILVQTIGLMAIRLVTLNKITQFSFQICRHLNVKIIKNILFNTSKQDKYLDESKFKANVTQKTGIIAHQYILQLISILSNSVTFFAILIYLLLQNPLYSVSAFALVAFVYITLMLFSRTYLGVISKDISLSQNKLMNLFDKVFIQRKYLRYFSKEKHLISEIDYNENILRKRFTSMHVISSSPRFILEGILIVLFIVALLIRQKLSFPIDIQTLVLLGIGFQRLLPVAQQIFMNWSNIKGTTNLRDDVESLIFSGDISRTSIQVSRMSEIKICDKYLSLPSGGTAYIDTDTITAGEKVLIKGESGVGKSTLIHQLAGISSEHRSDIKINQIPINRINQDWIYSRTIMLSQNDRLTEGSVLDNILLYRELDKNKSELIKYLIVNFQLTDADNNVGQFLETLIDENGEGLSGGQAQRILLIRALLEEREIVFLDEATSALDKPTERLVLKTAFQLWPNSTFICISHSTTVEDLFDSVINLSKEK